MNSIKTLPQSYYWGLVPGIITALGGSYKDTAFEPFEPLKFFRSPIISFFWYVIVHLSFPTEPVILKIGLASMLERITVETYKAIGGKPPGKFINCHCIDNTCHLEKDRGWFIDRIKKGF